MPSFLDPAWLWGASAVAIPIAIHFFLRRRFRTVRWAAMRFLRAAVVRSSRRQRLMHLLLLTLRVLILAFLAAAYARPSLRAAPPAAAALTPRHHVLILDRSASMRYEMEDGSLWDRARRAAADWLRSLPPGDRVLLLASPPVPRAPAFTGDREAAAAEMSLWEPADAAADVAAAVAEGWEAARAAAVPHAMFLVVTDMQRTSFARADRGAWRSLAERLAGRASLTLLDVGVPRPVNIAVTRVDFPDGAPVAGHPATVRAVVSASGGASGEVPVTFRVDGVNKGSRPAVPAADGTASCSMTVVFPTAGFHHVRAEVPADALAIDDGRFLAAAASEILRAVCVYDPARAAPLGRSTAFLELALAPEPDLSPYAARAIPLADLAAAVDETDILFLADLPRLSPEALAALERFVRRGGGLAVLAGPAVDRDFYNDVLHAGGNGILPARLERIETAPPASPFRVASPPVGEPFGAPFASARDDWGRVAVWSRWRAAADPLVSRRLLSYADGAPALVGAARGRGTVLLWTAGLDPAWTNLPARPVFVPWVHQVARALSAPRATRLSVDVGETLWWPAPTGAVPERVSLLSPAGERFDLVPARDADGAWGYATVPLDRVGLWYLEGVGPAEPVPLAAGLAPAESDLSRISPEEAAQLFPGLSVSAALDAGVRRAERPQGADLTRLCLFAALALLYLEGYVAWRAGRPAAAGSAL